MSLTIIAETEFVIKQQSWNERDNLKIDASDEKLSSHYTIMSICKKKKKCIALILFQNRIFERLIRALCATGWITTSDCSLSCQTILASKFALFSDQIAETPYVHRTYY